MITDSYPTWLEVNLSAVERNVRYTVQHAGVPLMAVVKANAYGHGAIEVGKTALSSGASWLGVARYGEARVLREAGIQAPILVLGLVMPAEVDEAIQNGVTLTMHSFEVAEMFSQRAEAAGKPVSAHLKVDTGMGRLGVQAEDALALARCSLDFGNIQLDGMYSHFAMADMSGNPLTQLQLKRFQQAVESLNAASIHPRWVHLSNTAGTLLHPEANFTMVRAGSAVVGIWPFDDELPYPDYLTPALAWKTRLASAKIVPAGWAIGYGQSYTLTEDELFGAIAIGYGDGYRRLPGNEVLIGGEKVPVRGRVCMDQTMIHLPKKFPVGEEVVLLGKQGNEHIRLEDLAARWKTAQVDVTTIINSRVPRVYLRD